MIIRKIGFHVSIAGGISNSVDNAKEIGCSAFQIFSRTPRRWVAKALDPNDASLFRQKLVASGIDRDSVVVHMPYLPNLSGPPGDYYRRSLDILAEEIQRCSVLEIPYLVIHLGSHLGSGSSSGIAQLTKAIRSALESNEGKKKQVTILIENNAGQKNSVGGTFEELRAILDKVSDRLHRVRVCLDTCHLFASGYDISSAYGVERTLEEFDEVVGLDEIRILHLNDSKGSLGSNLDRHEHIGLGLIGREGLGAFLNHKSLRALPFIMETPIDKRRDDKENLLEVRRMLE